jgi:hypothetical protein
MTDDPALFAIVPLPPPGPARDALLREAIAFGGPDEMLRKFFACEATERDLANQLAQTAEVANRVAEVGAHLMDMTEALTVRQDKQRRLDAKRKADQERRAQEDAVRAEQEQILQYLETHPEPGASTDDTHQQSGELHALEPPDKEHLDPEVEVDQGDLPNELEKGAPPLSGNYVEPDPEDLGGPKDPKQVPQPVAVSLW